MSRSVVALAALTAVAVGGAAHAARAALPTTLPAPIARPNPATFGVRLEYTAPLRTPDGATAVLPLLRPAVTDAALADARYLAFSQVDDLGGFIRAPIGTFVLSSGGRTVVGNTRGNAEIPLFAEAAGGRVRSFTFTAGPATTPPDNGGQPVPPIGVPPTTPPPTGGSNVPPANDGFGGRPPSEGDGGGTTTRTTPTTRPRPTTTRTTTTTPTTTTSTTTTITTTTTPPPTTTTTTSGGGGGPSSCGNEDIKITGNPANCRIYAVNMAPGDSAGETLTITNTSGSAYTLSLKATGTQNRLWQDLRMGVWEQGTASPSPLPPLLAWTTQFNDLATLQPGQSIALEILLFLPTSSGNDVQNLAAVIDFNWRAQG